MKRKTDECKRVDNKMKKPETTCETTIWNWLIKQLNNQKYRNIRTKYLKRQRENK